MDLFREQQGPRARQYVMNTIIFFAFVAVVAVSLVVAAFVFLRRLIRGKSGEEDETGWAEPALAGERNDARREPGLGDEPLFDAPPDRPRRARPVASKPDSGRPRRKLGLRDYLRSAGGRPGSVTKEQQEQVESLLAKRVPEWMSRQQADLLLSARDYANAVLNALLETEEEGHGEPLIERRLTLAVVADAEMRDYVAEWTEYALSTGDRALLSRPPRDGAYEIVERLATRLLLAEGYEID